MDSSDLHAVTVRLDVLRDIMIELAAALPPDRAAGVVTAIGNRLTERLCDMEIGFFRTICGRSGTVLGV